MAKTGTQVEVQREASHMRDTLYASKHCAAYLYDASKLVALCRFTGLALPADCGMKTVARGSGETSLFIPDPICWPRPAPSG